MNDRINVMGHLVSQKLWDHEIIIVYKLEDRCQGAFNVFINYSFLLLLIVYCDQINQN